VPVRVSGGDRGRGVRRRELFRIAAADTLDLLDVAEVGRRALRRVG